MTLFRAATLLFLLFLLLSPRQEVKAEMVLPNPGLTPEALSIRYPIFGGYCPRLCVEWFDGCNNCTCGHGRIDVCTQKYCIWRRRPRCLRYGF